LGGSLVIELFVEHLELLVHLVDRRFPHALALQVEFRRRLPLTLQAHLSLQSLESRAPILQRLTLVLSVLKLQSRMVELALHLHQLTTQSLQLRISLLQLSLVLLLQHMLNTLHTLQVLERLAVLLLDGGVVRHDVLPPLLLAIQLKV
jgi:hypothetical protein